MKQLLTFNLALDDGLLSSLRRPRKTIPVEVLVDRENTIVILDCECCEELLSSRLPGGVLIPIASTLKTFFEGLGMRNIDVDVTGHLMRRIYRGTLEEDWAKEMQTQLVDAVSKFTEKRKAA